MQISLTQYLALFSASMLAVGFLTPLMRLIAIRLNVVDNPNQSHKTHRLPIPYLGGIAIIIGVVAVTYFSIGSYSMSRENIVLASSVLLPAITLGLIGLIDDIRNLSPWPRFMAQSVAGLVTAILLISTDTVGSPTGSIILDALITILWIVGITNSINFFDNLDGGASGTVAITSLALLVLALQGEQYLIAAMAAVLVGATFATFSIPVLLLAVPILDTSVAVLSRLRRGISAFQGGKDHLSHRLMRSGLSKRLAVISLWIMTAYFAAIAIVISHAPYELEGLVSAVGAITWFAFFIFFLKKSDT